MWFFGSGAESPPAVTSRAVPIRSSKLTPPKEREKESMPPSYPPPGQWRGGPYTDKPWWEPDSPLIDTGWRRPVPPLRRSADEGDNDDDDNEYMDSDDSRVSRVSMAPQTQTPPRPSTLAAVIPDEVAYQSQANAGIAETVRENCNPVALWGAFLTAAGCRGRRSHEAPPRSSSCARTMSHHSHDQALPQTTQRPRRLRDDSN